MPCHDSPSPARRPQLSERTSSTQSVTRGSPTVTHSNKGLSQKTHKAYAVGHHRHSQGRVPSFGKNLNKLSRLTSVLPDNPSRSKGTSDVKLQTPSSSPPTQQIKFDSSGISLPRTSSKLSFRKHPSNVSLKPNGSASKTFHPAKSHVRAQSRNAGGQNLSLRGKAKFSMGSDDEDEEWVEASSSQSPSTTRHSPNVSKSFRLEDPPSPDEPARRTPPVLPHSPPQSPPSDGSKSQKRASPERHLAPSAQYSHPPDAEIVIHRLLNPHKPHSVTTQTSTISATITPSGSNGSPAFNHGSGLTLTNDPSMPADGVSRFLNATGFSSGSATPGSVSQLQSTLANIQRNHHHQHEQHPLSFSSSSPRKGILDTSHRAKSAGNLGQERLLGGENHPSFPPSPPAPNNTRVSPFKSARDPREAGKSLTQLKLDLQRMSTNREPAHAPAVQPPLVMMHGAHAVAGLGGPNGERSTERRNRLWEQAGLEYRNARRFHNMETTAMGRLERRREKKRAPERVKRANMARIGDERNADMERGLLSRPGSRGRVRFEVGIRDVEQENNEEDEGGGVEGLLKRMWEVNTEMGEGE